MNDTKKFAAVFPGQGSQSVGMMNAYGDAEIIKSTFDEAGEILKLDLWQMISNGSADELSQTINTQPILLTAAVAVWRLWKQLGGNIQNIGVVAGHSLGEYSAMVAAEMLDFADAVLLVRKRGEIMQEFAKGGAMAAILGLDNSAIIQNCQNISANGKVVEAVNFNANGQVVIAGTADAVDEAMAECKKSGAKICKKLAVSGPFHSSLMQPAAEKFKEFLNSVTLKSPKIPLINNVDVETISAENFDAAKIKDALYRQIFKPVRWVEIMQKVAALNINEVLEFAPGKVLAGLAKRCDSSLKGISLGDAESLKNYL